jgi:hypothetical protein
MNSSADLARLCCDPFDSTIEFVELAPERYGKSVMWWSPRRNLRLRGRDTLLAYLLAMRRAMEELACERVRAWLTDTRGVDESVVTFTYRGNGIAGLAAVEGARIELARVRVLTIEAGVIAAEECLETWTVLADIADGSLARADGSPWAIRQIR